MIGFPFLRTRSPFFLLELLLKSACSYPLVFLQCLLRKSYFAGTCLARDLRLVGRSLSGNWFGYKWLQSMKAVFVHS